MAQARLFDLDPDLLTYVPNAERAMALRVGQVSVERIAPGEWHPDRLGSPPWGLLIVDGMVAREIAVAGSTAAELLGTGDVLDSQRAGVDELVPSESAWTVLENARIAILDEHLLPVAHRWPGVTACLMARVARRADRLAVMQAISHLNRVDTRVLTTMWLLADRWGRVTPEGITLPLRLTHRTIARLVGARRPSVTSAISELNKRGLLARRTDGSWTLHGPPPEELERVGLTARISAVPAPGRPQPVVVDAPPVGPKPPHHVSMHQVAAQVRALAATYELQHARALEAGRSSRETRERSQRLREQTQVMRETLRPRRVPPSA